MGWSGSRRMSVRRGDGSGAGEDPAPSVVEWTVRNPFDAKTGDDGLVPVLMMALGEFMLAWLKLLAWLGTLIIG